MANQQYSLSQTNVVLDLAMLMLELTVNFTHAHVLYLCKQLAAFASLITSPC